MDHFQKIPVGVRLNYSRVGRIIHGFESSTVIEVRSIERVLLGQITKPWCTIVGSCPAPVKLHLRLDLQQLDGVSAVDHLLLAV